MASFLSSSISKIAIAADSFVSGENNTTLIQNEFENSPISTIPYQQDDETSFRPNNLKNSVKSGLKSSLKGIRKDKTNKHDIYSLVSSTKSSKHANNEHSINSNNNNNNSSYHQFAKMDSYEDPYEDVDIESRFIALPPRSHYSGAMNRTFDRRPIDPLQSRLIANLVVKYEHLPQFQAFMERYHCFPYVTEFKFPINMWINEHLENRTARAKKQQAVEAQEQQEQNNKTDVVVEPPHDACIEPQQLQPTINVNDEQPPSFDEEETDTGSNSSSDSDESDQLDDVVSDVADVYIVGSDSNTIAPPHGEEEGSTTKGTYHEYAEIGDFEYHSNNKPIHGEIEQDISTISEAMALRTRDMHRSPPKAIANLFGSDSLDYVMVSSTEKVQQKQQQQQRAIMEEDEDPAFAPDNDGYGYVYSAQQPRKKALQADISPRALSGLLGRVGAERVCTFSEDDDEIKCINKSQLSNYSSSNEDDYEFQNEFNISMDDYEEEKRRYRYRSKGPGALKKDSGKRALLKDFVGMFKSSSNSVSNSCGPVINNKGPIYVISTDEELV